MTKEISKRQQRREQMRREQMRSRLFTIGLVAVGAILVAFFFIYPNFKPVGAVVTPEAIVRPEAQGNGLGDPNAPIKIEEYSDFQCPYCRRFFEQTESQLVDAYVATGQVYFVYNSFGEFIGPESRASAEAAYCAGDQGKFWEMHDIIFVNQNGENIGDYTDRRLSAFAESVGLDMGAYNSCVSGGKYSDEVNQDFNDGRAAGIKATPSFVMTYTVNGETKTVLIEGAQPFSEFQSKIDAALAEIGN
ncbi:MAG: DsbA family protein [Chloroflexi bacterium]|nr:DsbA family protein [Chloroflexota bacterium]